MRGGMRAKKSNVPGSVVISMVLLRAGGAVIIMNKEQILERFQEMDAVAGRAMKLFESTGKGVPLSDVPKVREIVETLKVKLRAEYSRVGHIQNRKNLSKLEIDFYQPAINDALRNGELRRINPGTIPDHKWYGALYDVRSYIERWSFELKKIR